MRIPARVDLGLRLLVEITVVQRQTGAPVPRNVLLGRVAISEASLLTVLGDLRKREIVRSRRGVNGGWVLAQAADRITVADVVSALDGPLAPPSGPPLRVGAVAPGDGISEVWMQLGSAVHAVLGATTIADLAGSHGAEVGDAEAFGWYDNAS